MYPPLTTRAAELGIVIVSQPGFLSTLGDGFAAAFPGQAGQLYAFGSWRRAGLTVAGSSDAPVISAAPLLGIRDAMTRRTAAGQVLGPGERLTAREALALYTTEAAAAMHREDEIGSLEPGKLADFVVLDANPLKAARAGRDIQVLATVVDGTPPTSPARPARTLTAGQPQHSGVPREITIPAATSAAHPYFGWVTSAVGGCLPAGDRATRTADVKPIRP